MRQFEDENNRLKKKVADLTSEKAMLQDMLSEKL
jgi:cell division protein FtsB